MTSLTIKTLAGRIRSALPAGGLLAPNRHMGAVRRRRARLILGRVRLVAATFAVLTLLWIPLDLAIFKTTLAIYLAALRVLASVAFLLLALSFRRTDNPSAAALALTWLLTIPTLFFLISHPLLSAFPIVGAPQQVVAAGYAFLPFVMVAGLALFPLTLLEGLMLGLPPLLASLLTGMMGYQVLPFASHLGAQWLLLLLTMVATLAGMSQLHMLSQLSEQSALDPVTATYGRRIGEALLTQAFLTSQRAGTPLAVAMACVEDHAEAVERFGPEDGDDILVAAAAALRRGLRRDDLLIRWDHAVFVAVMPNTTATGATAGLERARTDTIGIHPDGRPITLITRVSERLDDQATCWEDLIALAERAPTQ